MPPLQNGSIAFGEAAAGDAFNVKAENGYEVSSRMEVAFHRKSLSE